ncbi:SpoVK/Ycf46/Vps4 family AAA+-type ATPase [Peribacillus deserti]|uniref:SpoVK/Ycf46/Vps4 family AAA+-type ATPase n=1 Tax=Peribacillus deserti TaxID=673318 RepID=A0ABS2QDZ3_9BACI|nr:AAA family ATPase [Peribacillus deserti]MBM7691386.1 SpoVK/Ycf46/Vps4 family AAA+-type ATPase [Peribacillus deserti]
MITENDKKHIEKQIVLLTQEADEKGYVQNYSRIFGLLEMLESTASASEESNLLKSELFSLLALTRKTLVGEDKLFKAWTSAAIEYNRKNPLANRLLAETKWKQYSDLFDGYSFPHIRETDNRTSKKKMADEYIDTCRKILDTAVEAAEDLREAESLMEKESQPQLSKRYKDLLSAVTEIEAEVTGLLHAALDYEASITGVFHTAVHFNDVKNHLEKFDELKSKWRNFFREDAAEVTTESSMKELNDLVGLTEVKKRINDFYIYLQYQKKRNELGFISKDEMSLNMVLTGNPGTGKTTLARLFAKIFNELGVLPREEVIEVDRSQLVGAYVGQTEENVRMVVEKALGGVLFIDEAYALRRSDSSGSDFGQTAIDTLVSLMTNSEYAGKFSVILAGYPEEMREFLNTNPGLRSRFPFSNQFDLPDYSESELLQIAHQTAADNDYVITAEAETELEKRIEREKVDETFGNARTVRTLVMEAIFKKGSSLEHIEGHNLLQFTSLSKTDFAANYIGHSTSPKNGLDQLIGLAAIKDEMKAIESFVKLQQIRRERNLPVVPVQLHAVFSGNPGTGKTTVAKLYSEILRDCGMLKRGHLITASRADFVAGYVGQTAIKTKKKIREALGGVLFIDEAYSLLSGSEGDFGKEVIDTLVDEMTKHNENLVVVLAGYPDEMNQLLTMNPGLKSRFKKFIHFPDYSSSELMEIITAYAESFQYELSTDAREYLTSFLHTHKVQGNARFATNLIDEVIQIHAYRVMSLEDPDSINPELGKLHKEDFIKTLERRERGER